jgi:hypothetical protein
MRFQDNNNKKLPVVSAGVHSCSPVAPQRYVKLFDAGVAADNILLFLRKSAEKMIISELNNFLLSPLPYVI